MLCGWLRHEQDAIIAFAREYDPQPFHVDPEAAKNTFVGTLIGSLLPFLLTYLMPPRSEVMLHFVNYWLELRHSDGMRAREADYWIHGHPRTAAEPRWNLVRNVLGWGQ